MICLYINSYLAKQSINVFYFLNLGISLYFDFDSSIGDQYNLNIAITMEPPQCSLLVRQ